MRKRLDPNKYFHKVNRGAGVILIQNREEFDVAGYSLKEYPDPEPPKRDYILPKSQLPYKSIPMANLAFSRKKLQETEYEIVDYKGGYAISKILEQG